MPHDTASSQGFRVLVIVSRPLDLPDLPNLADQWALQDGLRRVQAPAFLKMLRPPTVEGFRTEILNGYDIVHFDGHGALGLRCPNYGALHSPQEKKCDRCEALLEDEVAKGYFAFEREDGKLDALAAEELAEIVMSAGNPAKLVFLSACESAKGGETSLLKTLLGKGVPAVLGMNESVPLKATMALATPFYASLGAGKSIGKTVLATEAARRLAWRYPGGVFWRSAAGEERLGLNELLDAFAEVFGWEFRALPLDAKRNRVLGYLRNYDTSSLLVVDNAESIQDQSLWRFLEGIPQPSAALVTTRESLPREGREIRVPEMEPEEAGRLLISEARRRSPKWGAHLSPADLESLNEIAHFMQGHPLAIKLTAALVASRSLANIRDELRRNPPKGVSERFDVSYPCSPDSRVDY